LPRKSLAPDARIVPDMHPDIRGWGSDMNARTFLLTASAFALLASPAAARNGAWYVGGDFGGLLIDDVKLDVPAASSQLILNHDYGYDGALFVGYDLGAFRLEAEVAYKRTDLKDIESSIAAPPVFPVPFTDFPGTGAVSTWSIMGNGIWNAYTSPSEQFGAFFGVGLGMANVKMDYGRDIPPFFQVADASDSVFAWQIVAGLRQAVSDNIDITVRYRFFNADNIRTVDYRGFGSESRFRSHSLLGGITFNFGAPPPPPPPPPASETPLETPH
jgi:opacity protein-like surface antigen